MNIISKLQQKPWLADTGEAALEYQPGLPAKTALSFFIAVVCVIFFLFSVTYLSRSQYADFQSLAAEPWLPLYQPLWLWLNTGWLLLASISFQVSVLQSKRSYPNGMFIALSFAVVFSFLFIFGQWMVWQQLIFQGFVINSNPANSYFYLLTAIHLLHLCGGIFALARVVILFIRQPELSLLQQSLGLCAKYWHFLLLLWLYLFFLLTASPSTYNTIAAWCGL